MATSRTGTKKWKDVAARRLRTAKAEGVTHCPRCRAWLDYDQSRRPNSAEVDHIIAHANGGADSFENTQVLCRRCNQQVGSKTPTKKRVQRKARVLTPEVSGVW